MAVIERISSMHKSINIPLRGDGIWVAGARLSASNYPGYEPMTQSVEILISWRNSKKEDHLLHHHKPCLMRSIAGDSTPFLPKLAITTNLLPMAQKKAAMSRAFKKN